MTPRISEIQHAVAQHFGTKLIDMVSGRTGRHVARPRQVAMYLSRGLTPHSLPAIGRQFGNRDHTTVLSACRRIDELIECDKDLAASVAKLIDKLS